MRNRVGELDAACLTDAESRSKQRCCGSKGVDVVNVHQKTCASTEVADPQASRIWYKESCGAGRRSVPAEGVLSHDGRRDLLCAHTVPLAAAAASTTRRYPAIAGTVHPCGSAAWDGTVGHTASGAGHGAGALVSNALVPVPAGHEEHGRAVGNGTCDGTRSDTG
jgi:hypothetical protein